MSEQNADGEPELPPEWDEPEVDAILEGAVDLHVHPFPSPLPRRVDILEAARDVEAARYRAIVVKSHHHSMVTDVLALEESLRAIDVQVFAGVALNAYVGGINPHAVELALTLGGKIVWFPTYSSHVHRVHVEHEAARADDEPASTRAPRTPSAARFSSLRLAPVVAVLDETGRLRPEVFEVLELVKAHDAIVTGGHMSVPEIDALVVAAKQMGIEKILVNHPQYVIGATPDQVGAWARRGVFIEHSVGMYHDSAGHKQARYALGDLEAYIAAAGTDRTILVSDTGQERNLRPVDTIRVALRRLLDVGYRPQDLAKMSGANAASLLA